VDRSEAARLLGVSEATLARWVRQGLLRARDRRGERFDRSELLRWARERDIPVETAATAPERLAEPLLVEAIERGAVVRGAHCASAHDAIGVAVDALRDLDADGRRRLLEEVLARERLASTGLGEGVAVPHTREPLGDLIAAPLASVVMLDRALDWAALDGQPVHSVLLLASPTAASHLEMLAQLGRALHHGGVGALLARRPERAELLERLHQVLAPGAA